jgi:hypothetical protein
VQGVDDGFAGGEGEGVWGRHFCVVGLILNGLRKVLLVRMGEVWGVEDLWWVEAGRGW